MAKDKSFDKNIEEIKKQMGNKKVILGLGMTLKNLKTGTIAKVFLCSNLPEDTNKDINYYAKIANVDVVELNYPNEELGALCKKPFSVSVIGLLK